MATELTECRRNATAQRPDSAAMFRDQTRVLQTGFSTADPWNIYLFIRDTTSHGVTLLLKSIRGRFRCGPVSDPGGLGDGGGKLAPAAAAEQELKKFRTRQQDGASRSSKAQSHVQDSLESFRKRTKAENPFLPVFLI